MFVQANHEVAMLRDLLDDTDKETAVVVKLHNEDGEGLIHAYRIFKWMLSHGISVQIHHIKEVPYFMLRSMEDFLKLTNALDVSSKGTLKTADMSVVTPHYMNPLDEDLGSLGETKFMVLACLLLHVLMCGENREVV